MASLWAYQRSVPPRRAGFADVVSLPDQVITLRADPRFVDAAGREHSRVIDCDKRITVLTVWHTFSRGTCGGHPYNFTGDMGLRITDGFPERTIERDGAGSHRVTASEQDYKKSRKRTVSSAVTAGSVTNHRRSNRMRLRRGGRHIPDTVACYSSAPILRVLFRGRDAKGSRRSDRLRHRWVRTPYTVPVHTPR